MFFHGDDDLGRAMAESAQRDRTKSLERRVEVLETAIKQLHGELRDLRAMRDVEATAIRSSHVRFYGLGD
jgi:vacuolar-type H+-ATPase subunit E/Vma4